ncbi:hypothetical protein [Microbacterium sp. H83]|uniref:hypothetical protein n=1 Tax=Microbacterium sp. H83 TaxID=1827324 RepID=UPI0007F41E64|nr:hypothetical protein [Microbacterium sp. H83]OAN38334.1 hypothetical protein A4X16_02805 [Microbacterium sp. H83]
MKRLLAAMAVGLVLLTAAPSAAHAAEDPQDVHPAIAEALKEIPGGVAVAPDRAVWREFDMTLSVVDDARLAVRAVGSCATGRICAYLGTGLTSMYASWGVCGVLPAPSGQTMRSMANARTSGYAQARNGSSVVATAAAGAWTNVYSTVTSIRCVL